MPDNKKHRRTTILKLVTGEPVPSQASLLERLKSMGIKTTQATISRDIRDLGLVKAADGEGGYRYVTRRERDWSTPVAEGSVSAIDCSGNLLVIRTRAGFAQSVAAAVDSLGWFEILGTVGGDDTVVVVLRSPEAAGEVISRLKSLFSLDEQG